jgi:thiamine-phosphate pyrophosphorylase
MPSTPIMRTIDASLNRAAEGLRVVEDYVRMVLDDAHLSSLVKSLRHEMADAAAAIPAADRHAARDTLRDVGTGLSTSGEAERADEWGVCAANLNRVQQSLRSLEEYGKLVAPALARRFKSLRYRVYTLEKAVDITRLSRKRLQDLRLCVLVDGRESAAEFDSLVRALVKAGVGMIQLRDKQLEDRELAARARQLRESTRGSATLAVVNDRPDLALLAGVDGVHLGQGDLSVKDARFVVGTEMLIGVSTHNLDQARAAVLDGANYLGAGPTFASRTKSFGSLAGLDYLRQAAAEITLPTFAIGGIGMDNLSDVLATGISRVAVGAAVSEAGDPAVAARELLGMLNSPKPGR